mgnify:CR=1 FL=1
MKEGAKRLAYDTCRRALCRAISGLLYRGRCNDNVIITLSIIVALFCFCKDFITLYDDLHCAVL